MTYKLETRMSPNVTREARVPVVYGFQRGIDSICIHHWGTVAAHRHPTAFNGVVNWLCNPESRASAHEVIEAGRVTVLADASSATWHSGSNKGNARTYSLELHPRASDADYATASARLADLWRSWGGPTPLTEHRQWFNTACPGAWDIGRLNRMARTKYAALTRSEPPTVGSSYAHKTAWPERAIVQRINAQLWEDNAYEGTKFALVEALRRAGYGTDSVTAWGRLQQLSRWLRGQHGLRGPETQVEIWKRVQLYLRRVGRYTGAIDGSPGPLTTRALISWLNSIRPAYL